MGLFFPGCTTSHFSLLNFMRFLSDDLCSLLRSIWMPVQISDLSPTPPSFVASANLLRVHSAQSPRLLMKRSKCIGSRTTPRAQNLWLASIWAGLMPLITNLPVLMISVHFTIHLFSPFFCPWRCPGKQLGKPCQRQDKQHPLFSPCLLSQS